MKKVVEIIGVGILLGVISIAAFAIAFVISILFFIFIIAPVLVWITPQSGATP